LRDAASEDTITPPAKGSKAATVATTEAAQSDGEGELEESLSNDFDSIDWTRLKRKKSWVFKYGYRVALLRIPARTYWICKHCLQYKVHSFKPLEVTKLTTAAITHLAQVQNLARFAIDILTIPASSCECERLFSELGNLLELRRRKIGSQLLAAIQCVCSWHDGGFKPPSDRNQSEITDEEIGWAYDICSWDTDAR
jgi:hypothetical protein